MMNTNKLHFRRMGALLAALALLLIAPAQADDKQAAAAYNAAAGLFNTELWDNAAKGYEEYLKNHPRHELVGHGHYGLGLCYFTLKRYDEAATEYNAYTVSIPGSLAKKLFGHPDHMPLSHEVPSW